MTLDLRQTMLPLKTVGKKDLMFAKSNSSSNNPQLRKHDSANFTGKGTAYEQATKRFLNPSTLTDFVTR